ncbi:MAG: energy-coupling factor ABC transporter ATP-binding protein [Candidatus Limnocylindrales bacterium]
MSLRLEGLTYRYVGTTRASLEGIDLALEPGQVLGLVGANEAGKSTLCLVAAGLAPATIGGRLEGRVLIDDLDTAKARPFEVAQRCGILFQNPVTQLSGTSPTVWEEVAFGPRNLALSLGEVVERVEASLRTMRIEELAARDPARLSGGQAQLVALAGVLALRPRYLVLDEPTSQLDPEGTRLVGEALIGVAATAGVGVLIAEHKTDLLELLASRVAVLEGGRLATLGPTTEVLADARLPGWGVEPPARVRLARAAAAIGASLPGLSA